METVSAPVGETGDDELVISWLAICVWVYGYMWMCLLRRVSLSPWAPEQESINTIPSRWIVMQIILGRGSTTPGRARHQAQPGNYG